MLHFSNLNVIIWAVLALSSGPCVFAFKQLVKFGLARFPNFPKGHNSYFIRHQNFLMPDNSLEMPKRHSHYCLVEMLSFARYLCSYKATRCLSEISNVSEQSSDV